MKKRDKRPPSDRTVAVRQQIKVAGEADARLSAFIHDAVLATLLGAAGGIDAATAAQAAIQQFDELFESSASQRAVDGETLITWLRHASAESPGGPVLDVEREEGRERLLLPQEAADALLAAATEAMRNVARHAAAARCVVSVTLDSMGIVIAVDDDGVGFDPGKVPSDRLGLRVSVAARMEHVPGAWSAIESSEGKGTRIKIGWSRLPRGSSHLSPKLQGSVSEIHLHDHKVHAFESLARPMLERIATGEPLSMEERKYCRIVEAQLRDQMRAGLLVDGAVAKAALDARRRGVKIILLDDGLNAVSEDTQHLIRRAVVGALEFAQKGQVLTARVLPAGRAQAARVVIAQDDGQQSIIEVAHDGAVTSSVPVKAVATDMATATELDLG